MVWNGILLDVVGIAHVQFSLKGKAEIKPEGNIYLAELRMGMSKEKKTSGEMSKVGELSH